MADQITLAHDPDHLIMLDHWNAAVRRVESSSATSRTGVSGVSHTSVVITSAAVNMALLPFALGRPCGLPQPEAPITGTGHAALGKAPISI